MAESNERYPEPLIVIKPDLQATELFNESELKSLRQDLQFFTEDELQAAILQAQAEINAELIKKHATTSINKYPPKNVKIQTINNTFSSPKKSKSAAVRSQQQLQKQLSIGTQPQRMRENVQRNLSCSSQESRSVVIAEEQDNFGYDDDFDNSDNSNQDDGNDEERDSTDQDTDHQEDTDEETSSHNVEDPSSSSNQSQNIKLAKNKSNKTPKSSQSQKPSLVDQTLQQLFADRQQSFDVSEQDIFVGNPQFCEQEDLEQISVMLDTINITFGQLFQCIQVNKTQSDVLDDLELERSNKRSKEFESRFNRANYQLERDMRALSKINRSYGDYIDVGKLKGLLRSCCRLLEMILHYIPLSGGAFFPHRIQIFIEILVDCGTLISRLDVSTCSTQLANMAKHLRKLDFMVIKYEKDKLELASQGIKNGAKISRQNQSKPVLTGVPKNSTNKSNLARLRKLRPDQGQFNQLARTRSHGKLTKSKSTEKSLSNGSSPYGTIKNGGRAKSADLGRSRAMSSLQNNTLHQLSFDEFTAAEENNENKNENVHEDELDETNKTIGVQCTQSTNVQGVQSCAVQKDKGVQQGATSRSMSRNSGLYSMELPNTSRYDEIANMDRVLSRIHNLELLALRQGSASRTSQHNSSYQGNNKQLNAVSSGNYGHALTSGNLALHNSSRQNDNTFSRQNLDNIEHNQDVVSSGHMAPTNISTSTNVPSIIKKSGNVNTSSLIARLEMMKSDFLLIEQKYC